MNVSRLFLIYPNGQNLSFIFSNMYFSYIFYVNYVKFIQWT